MASPAAEMISKNEYVAKVIPIRIKKDARGVSRELPVDPFTQAYRDNSILEPPYDMFTLACMSEVSSELGPAIEAMVVNIAKMGQRVVTRDGLPYDDNDLDISIKQERAKVKNFFANAILEPTETFTSFRASLRHDLESTGNAYSEVLPNLMTNEPAGLNHLPSWQMRIRKEDDELTDCEVLRAVEGVDGKWTIQSFPYRKRFRRFVQIRDDSNQKVYFKEWGDPRNIDMRDGHVFTSEEMASEEFNEGNLATEVIHLKLYCPRSPYGLPRWIGNLFTIFGNRAAEVINYTTFRNNNIPALILMGTNVQLTEASIERIRKFVEERIQGDDNYSTILLVEAEPMTEGMKDPGNMKLELKELVQAQHTDAMFVKYMERGDDKIRRSFRLPPIFMGRAEDYTRATADASRKVGEEQVFRPERTSEDVVWNQTILPALRAANVLLKSNSPDVTDNYELTQLLAVAEQSGGLSPIISRMIVEDVLGKDLPPIDDTIPGNIPFSLTMQREQMENKLETSGVSTETAVDQLEKLKVLVDGNEAIPTEARESVDYLLKLLKTKPKSKKVMVPRISKKEEPQPTNVVKIDVGHIKRVDKADKSEERIVGGAVLVPGVVDLQGDIYAAEVVVAAAQYWLEHYMEDPKENGIKFMHEGETIYDAARPVQSWCLDRDMEFEVDVPAAGDDHPSKEMNTISYPKGTWMLYARIRDDKLWGMFKSGELSGWSIGGVALVQHLKRLVEQYKKSLSSR